MAQGVGITLIGKIPNKNKVPFGTYQQGINIAKNINLKLENERKVSGTILLLTDHYTCGSAVVKQTTGTDP